MEIIQSLFGFAIIGFMFFAIAKIFSGTSPPKRKEKNDVNFNEIASRIDELQKNKNRLSEVENLITDLEISGNQSQEEGKAFLLKWYDAAGQEHEYNFMFFDDSAEREHLLEIANIERKRVRTSLTLEISNLQQFAINTDRNE